MSRQITMALPPPIKWEDFEELTLDAVIFNLNDQHATRYGNAGSTQNGVDILCRKNGSGQLTGVQCKRIGKLSSSGDLISGGLSLKTLILEVNKAKTFTPQLEHYIIATTQPRNVALQSQAAILSEQNIKTGLFSISMWFWEDYIGFLHKSSELLNWYYANVLKLTGVFNPDLQILYLFHLALSRPAFNIKMDAEESGLDLREALNDTETALRVGNLRDRSTRGSLCVAHGGVSMIANPIWQQSANNALINVQEARAYYKKSLDDGSFVLAANKIIVVNQSAADKMDDLRRAAVDNMNTALVSANLPKVDSSL